MPSVFGRRLGPLRRNGEGADAALAGMLAHAEVADRGQMRVGQDVLDAVHALNRDIGPLERFDPLGGGALLQLFGDHRVGALVVLAARLLRGELRRRQHLRPADDIEERLPLLVVVDQRADVAVLRLVGPPVGREDAQVAGLAVLRLEAVTAEMVAEHDLKKVFEHRNVDALALAGLLAAVEGGADRAGNLLADGAVGHDHRRVARLGGALPLQQVGQAGGSLDEIVVGRLGGIGTALAVAEAAGIDDPRVDLLHVVVGKPQARHGLRADVVDQHIAFRRERETRVARGVLLEVQDDRALVAVDAHVDRAHARVAERPRVAHHVAFGWLDLDYVGAEVAEDLGRVRAHHYGSEVKNPNAVKGSGHYSGWMLASLTSLAQCAISLWMNLASSVGAMGATSTPMVANFSFTSPFFSASSEAPLIFCTTSFGVFAGATSANQAMSSYPGSSSAMAGWSPASGVLFNDVTPRPRSFPPLAWAMALPRSTKVKASEPPMVSVTACGMPLYGTSTTSSLPIDLSIASDTCEPAEP